MNVKTIFIGLSITLGLTTQSCNRKGCTDVNASNYDSKAKKDDGTCLLNSVGAYDRAKMLSDLADNYIIPGYTNYEKSVTNLKVKVEAFNGNTTVVMLDELRKEWKDACNEWQKVAFIDFGPAKDISLTTQTNIFPVDTDLIDNNIANESYNLQIPANFDAKGFQALDYLLFGTGNSEQEIVDYFNNSTGAKDYLLAVTEELKVNATAIRSTWENSYAASFKGKSTDNSEGSSISELINGLSSHYETNIRKGKVGLPAGVFNGFSQQSMPMHVEGFYSKHSIEFAVSAMEGLNNYIKGNSFEGNREGQGLDDYINFVAAKDANGTNLEMAIETQISEIISALNGHANSLSEEVANNNTEVMDTYQKMQKLVPLIKVDMTSALGVLVTYQDNDGD